MAEDLVGWKFEIKEWVFPAFFECRYILDDDTVLGGAKQVSFHNRFYTIASLTKRSVLVETHILSGRVLVKDWGENV